MYTFIISVTWKPFMTSLPRPLVRRDWLRLLAVDWPALVLRRIRRKIVNMRPDTGTNVESTTL